MNPWIEHVKDVAKRKNISFKEALNDAKYSYKKKSVMQGRGLTYNDWEKAYMAKNKKQMIDYINQYGKYIPPSTTPLGVAISIIKAAPAQSIEARRAIDSITDYSPEGIFETVFK